MNKKHDIKRFKVFHFISLTFVGPTYIAKIGACIVIESYKTPSAILDQVDTVNLEPTLTQTSR